MRDGKHAKAADFGSREATERKPRLRRKEVDPVLKGGKATPDPPRTEGLNPLDLERAASIADEGGTSAATVEKERRASTTSGRR